MKIDGVKSELAACAGLVAVLSASTGFAALPTHNFACQVVTTGAKVGYVLVQADTREQAAAVAAGATAQLFDGSRDSTSRVVECILYNSEKFSDIGFQEQFEKLPG